MSNKARNAAIISLRAEGKTLQELADAFGLTKARVGQICTPGYGTDRYAKLKADPERLAKLREYSREYSRRPEVKARAAEYRKNLTPEQKLEQKLRSRFKYHTDPKVLAAKEARLAKLRARMDALAALEQEKQDSVQRQAEIIKQQLESI